MEINGGELREYVLTPADFGLQEANLESLRGGDGNQNARMLQDVFHGRGKVEHANAIAMNAAAVRYLTGNADSLKIATSDVLDHLASGKAAEHLQRMQEEFKA